MNIPLFRPAIRESAIEAVSEVLRSGWLGLGPKTAQFEQAFSDYVGVPYCVGMNSCSSALHIALHMLDLPPGSEVITTPVTFVSTNHVILYENCRPVFADVQAQTGNLDVNSVAERVTDKTKAIMLMHYGGYPCDLDAFYALARERDLSIIEDCAHACGATYKGGRIGSYGDLHAFSFHPVKNLAMGDGGALTCRSAVYADRAQKLRWMGIDRDTYQRSKGSAYQWEYDLTEIGFKYHLNDVQAAIGLAQLPYLDEDNARRAQIAAMYRAQLQNIPGVQCLTYENDRQSSYHLFCILVENRNDLVDKLQASGVDVGVHYIRNDKYAIYEEEDLPNAEYFSSHVISLPMHIYLTPDQIGYIADVIRGGW